MAESFESLDHILRDWAKGIMYSKCYRGIEQVQAAERRKEEPFFVLENDSKKKKYSISLSRQSSETKPSTKLFLKLLQDKKSFLCLEFKNTKTKILMTIIYLKYSVFSQSLANTIIRNETSKLHFLK